jgi:Xaa-Pro aminopeptidase
MHIDRHRERRARVMQAMAERGGGVAVHFTAPGRLRSRDSEYPYRFDSTFWYLTGFDEPDSALVLVAVGGRRQSVLFCRPRDEEREVWDGFRHGPELAQHSCGVDAAHAIERVDELLPELLADVPAVFYALGASSALDTRVQGWLQKVRSQSRSGRRAPTAVHDLAAIVDEMRVVKDGTELDAMRRAARVSAAAHVRAMRACRVGMHEYELEAELLHEFRRQGAQAPAYTPIVAAGANACVLHYPAGQAQAKDGELVLIDAACEIDGYAADVTRTFPANGRFSAGQRALYDVVLAAQQAAIDCVRPGRDVNAAHDAATRVLTQGLLDLGLLTGSLDGALESKSFRQFFMHRTGHWLGLDVHDVGDYREAADAVGDGGERPWRVLVPGMVTTVEPGLYVRPAPNVDARFHHIGIRIEDDVAVTADGCEILSADAPRSAADVEALMRR